MTGQTDAEKQIPSAPLPANHVALPRRTASDTDGDVQRVLAKLEATGQDLTILRLLANADHLFRPYILLSSQLLHGGVLPPHVRECVILWLAARSGTSYELAEHVPLARVAGVSGEVIDAITAGGALDTIPDLDDESRLAMLIAGELQAGRGVPKESFATSVQCWGVAGALELLMAVAYWGGMVRMLIEGLGLDSSDRAAGRANSGCQSPRNDRTGATT